MKRLCVYLFPIQDFFTGFLWKLITSCLRREAQTNQTTGIYIFVTYRELSHVQYDNNLKIARGGKSWSWIVIFGWRDDFGWMELVFGQFIGGIELIYQTNSWLSQWIGSSIAWTGSVLSHAEESFCCLVFTCVRIRECVWLGALLILTNSLHIHLMVLYSLLPQLPTFSLLPFSPCHFSFALS